MSVQNRFMKMQYELSRICWNAWAGFQFYIWYVKNFSNVNWLIEPNANDIVCMSCQPKGKPPFDIFRLIYFKLNGMSNVYIWWVEPPPAQLKWTDLIYIAHTHTLIHFIIILYRIYNSVWHAICMTFCTIRERRNGILWIWSLLCLLSAYKRCALIVILSGEFQLKFFQNKNNDPHRKLLTCNI